MKKVLVTLIIIALFPFCGMTQDVGELQEQIQQLQALIEAPTEEGLSEEEATAVAQAQLGFASTTTKAQLWAGLEISRYQGYFSYRKNNSWKNGEFSLNASRQITRVAIWDTNNQLVVLHDDPHNPLSALPIDEDGFMVDYHISVDAYEGNEYVAYGYTHYPYLEAGQSVAIELELASQLQTLEFVLPEGVQAGDLVVRINGQDVGWYNEVRGEFEIWLDPNLGVVEYQIINRQTGEVLQVGTLSPIGEPTVNTGQAVNITYAGGIEVLDLTEKNYFYFPRRDFPGVDQLAGQLVASKAFIIKRSETKKTELWLQGFEGGFDAFRYHETTGELLAMEIMVNNYGEFYIPAGPSRVVLVFYGHEDVDGQFSLSVSHSGGGGFG